MRSARAAKKFFSFPRETKLCTTRNPLIAKKMRTPSDPPVSMKPKYRRIGSGLLPYASAQQCETITSVAARKRRRLKLFARPTARSASEYERVSSARRLLRRCVTAGPELIGDQRSIRQNAGYWTLSLNEN